MQQLHNQSVLILGLGDSGLAMARWCVRNGAQVQVVDTRAEPPHLAVLRAELPDVKFVQRGFDATLVEGQGVRAVFKSPGLSPESVAPVWQAATAAGLWVGTELTLFAQALLDEAATLFLNGEPETARLILRDLVHATIGFEQLATITHKPSKSLHRMLSPTGNPSMDNLAAIFLAMREKLQVSLSAHSVAV
jgi:DNA-binding phage protein